MGSHEPGPWEYDNDGRVFHRREPLLRYILANMESGDEANWRLVSASPNLLEAGTAQTKIIRQAQSILNRYLQGQPSGLGRDQAIDALLGLLDGPDQRSAQDAWDDAVSKATGEGK